MAATFENLKRVATFFGLLASVATIIALIITFIPKTPAIEIHLISCDILTSTTDTIAEFRSYYEYRGSPVEKLWRLRIELSNTGDKTIVGRGNSSNLINERTILQFRSQHKLVNLQKVSSSFDHKLEMLSDSSLGFEFDQWRKGENLIYEIFFISSKEINENPHPLVSKRNIIDGDITVVNQQAQSREKDIPLLDRQTYLIALLGKIFAIGFSAFMLLFLILYLLIAIVETVKIAVWKYKNEAHLREFLKSEELLSNGDLFDAESVHIFKQHLSDYVTNPWKLPEEIWQLYPHQRFPVESPVIENWKSTFMAILIIIILILCSISILAKFL